MQCQLPSRLSKRAFCHLRYFLYRTNALNIFQAPGFFYNEKRARPCRFVSAIRPVDLGAVEGLSQGTLMYSSPMSKHVCPTYYLWCVLYMSLSFESSNNNSPVKYEARLTIWSYSSLTLLFRLFNLVLLYSILTLCLQLLVFFLFFSFQKMLPSMLVHSYPKNWTGLLLPVSWSVIRLRYINKSCPYFKYVPASILLLTTESFHFQRSCFKSSFEFMGGC